MSKKQTPYLPDDLEKELEGYYTSPEPGPEFVSRLERGLHSKLKEQEQKQMFGRSKRKLAWGFGLALAAVLIGFLVTSPTVVAAMKRLLGYIPGIGLVDSGSPLRVLVEPISQTREGITITVNEAVLSSEKTVIIFTEENIPFDKLSHREDVAGCGMNAELRLPDGASLQMMGGQGEGWGTGYEYRFTFESVPVNVNEATLLIPCIQNVLPGALPENWELPLRFVPAPSDLTAVPVIEYTPSPVPNSGAGRIEPKPLSITKVIDAGDGYILIGEFHQPARSDNGTWSPQPGGLILTDGNGQEIFWDYPQDIDLPTTDWPKIQPWALKVTKGFVPPLHIRYPIQYIFLDPSHAKYEFEFDAGPNPQAGLTWELNREIQLAGYTFTLASISVTPPLHGAKADGYNFSFISPDGKLNSVSVNIEGYTPLGGGGGGGGGPDTSTMWSAGLTYAELPKGKLKIVISDLSLYGETEEWTLDWQPDDSSGTDLPAPTETPQACLTVDSWQAALTNPLPLPAGLTGKVIAYGRTVEDGKNPSPENYGVYIANLDGSGKQVIGPGVWPSLSPDGTQAAYAWDDGIHLVDLASGENHIIPNTNKNDYGPRWSPDGQRIAFIRIDDFNLYLINPDGTGLQKVIDAIDYEQLLDWSPDGESLLYGVDTQDGMLLKKLDIASGAVSDLFTVDTKALNADISPDGSEIAFFDKIGEMNSGLYISHLDGSNRELVAQMGHWMVVNPLWSPDGKWLLVGIVNTDTAVSDEAKALVNLETCQIIRLPITGTFYSWIP